MPEDIKNSMSTVKQTVYNSIFQPSFDKTREHLLNFRTRDNLLICPSFWRNISDVKKTFVNQNDQLGAKAAWCLEVVANIQDCFVKSHLSLKDGQFKEAWELLAQCETGVKALGRHFTELDGEFGIEHVRIHAAQLQELFQLKWGLSPGFLFEEVHCSVCNFTRSLRKDCGHIVGEIYDGEICGNIVVKAKLLEISIVDSPAQKYSIIWPDDKYLPQFFTLKYLADELLSPWDVWSFQKEIRRDYHPSFNNVGRNASCPCGSDLKYKRCCMRKDTVPDFPHFQFLFENDTRGQFSRLEIIRGNS